MITSCLYSPMRRITLQVKDNTHKLLKLLAVFENKSLNEVTEEALEDYLSKKSDALRLLLDDSRNHLAFAVASIVISLFVPLNQRLLIQQNNNEIVGIADVGIVDAGNGSLTHMDGVRLIGDSICGQKHILSRLNGFNGV